MERITLSVRGARREFLFCGSPGRGPLVVFLHGTGATAAWADGETGWSALAAREGFSLAIPQALPPDPDRPPKFLTNPPRWQDEGGAEDVEFLAAVIDHCGAVRACVTGFSNGAAMAFRVAAELTDRVAAVAAVAGHCRVPDPRPARPVPTLYAVGSADPLVPLRGGDVRNPWHHRYVRRPPVVETLEAWARAIGCDVVPRPEPGGGPARAETFPGPVLFRSVVIDGLGHHWPGGKGQFNHRIAGPPADTVNGTEMVWEFFRHQV